MPKDTEMTLSEAEKIVSRAVDPNRVGDEQSFSKAKKQALDEYDDQCAFCGIGPQYSSYQSLMGHHINGDDEDHRVNNLIIVCGACHKQIHRKEDSSYQPFHDILPDESIYTSEKVKQLGEQRDLERPEDRYVLRIVSYSVKLNNKNGHNILSFINDLLEQLSESGTIEKLEVQGNHRQKVEFQNQSAMKEFEDELNQRIEPTASVQSAHPLTKDTEITHTLKLYS